MENPWKEVALDDYENHMALSNVYQLQTLDKIMGEQFAAYSVPSVAILGVAGGNGLGNLTCIPSITSIYGIDINKEYLRTSADRYPELAARYHTVLADINESSCNLPHAELVIANLFIEYVGCENFAKAIAKMTPTYVSCVIQIDPSDSFVSDSPYTSKLENLDSVHNAVDGNLLISTMGKIGYVATANFCTNLPNGKIFRRIDFNLTTDIVS